MTHKMETYKRSDGKRGWRITSGNGDIVATDGGQGYENEKDCLAGLFSVFFADWDMSFLELYQKWQKYKGQAYSVPPEAQEGVPVALKRDLPTVDLGDDPDGDVSVDPRDT